MPDILINVTQLAQKLGISRQTVHMRKRVCEQQGWQFDDLLPRPAAAPPGANRWYLGEVDAWLAKRPMRRVV